MSQQLNFQSLEDFVQREPDDISTIQVWYEKLSEYELDGSESQKDVDTLLYALRYLMNYSFTAAEELKEVAEREAVAMAEKEEKWEEQRQLMREEIEDLRQRITVGADATESSEAYVAQIDSLKEENRTLQQLSRDRDMEMADQRDRFEALVSRADQLTRERDALMDHKAQMEDTIRELNRRISSKSEDASNEWETKKLKLRNEQAVTLSKQMQAVVSQNDQLRSEVERVSDALEDATRLIEDSSQRIAELAEELRLSQKKEIQLNNENKSIREKLDSVTQTLEEMEAKAMDSDEILKNKIQQQTEMIGELQQKLYESQVEVEELRGRIRADTTEEKEAELEKLKQELITATKMARSLLGQETSSKGEPTETTDWPRRLMLAEQRLQEAQNKIDTLKKTTSEMEDTIVMKEDANKETAAELEKLREAKFGSAREELEHLGQQLKMREEQIAKLTRHCTLLQIELGRCAEKTTTDEKMKKESAKERETGEEEEERVEEMEKTEKEGGKPSVEEIVGMKRKEEEEHQPIEKKSSPVEEEEEEKKTGRRMEKERTKERSRGEYEQQAMIIAGLNFELMMLMEELETKNRQLVEMEHSLTEGKRKADEGRGKLKLAYEEVTSLRRKPNYENQDSEEENKAELTELRRFAESINIGGSELERRTEEVTRKLIAEKIERIKLSRSEKSLRFRCARATDAAKKLRERLVGTRQQAGRQNARLQYELDITCYELASVQNKLLHSVSLKEFNDLSRKYREIVKRETVGGRSVEDGPLADFDIRKGAPEEDPNELSAKNKYLKKMVEILTDQNEFWSNETDILQKENEELKKFLEDMENESDSRTVLVSIESRLMETIRELSEMAKEHAREHRKMRDAEETLAKLKMSWHAERKHFVHVISMLQQAYQTQRNNNLATVTVAQMESLRDRIVETGEDCERAKEERNIAERVREQLEIQLMNAKSLKKARDLIDMERGDMQRLEKALKEAFSAERVQTAKAERLQNLLRLKERAETQKNEELEELRRHNEELIALVGSGGSKKIVKETVMESKRQEERRREIEKEPESEYEMDFDSSESTSSSNSERPRRMKIMEEGEGKESSEKRLAQIKETAETIIRSYREQLAQKDSAIEGYRELLLVKINEVSSVPKEKEIIVREERRVADEETEERLRQTIHENARMREEIEELEAANRNLYRERRKSVIPTVFQIGTQTEEDDHSTVIYSPAPQRGIITPIPEETERSQIGESMEKERESNLTLKHKNEINRLQERIRRLTTTNKNLLIACEIIKEEAMTQLAAKSKREERRENEENSQERVENLKLRTEVVNMRKKLKESQEKAEKLAKEVELNKKNAQEEIWKWEQRKRTEESIVTLRKKLKETEEREEDLKNRLKRREKRLEEMGMESEERRKEMERIQRRLTETKTEREKIQKESQKMELIKEKQIVLEKKLIEREKELSAVNGRLREYEQRNKKLTGEILSLKKTIETTKRNESFVQKTREKETKKTEKEVMNKEIKEENKVNERMEDQIKEMKKKLRLAELRHQEALERLEILEKDLEKSQSDCERLMKRLSIREENSSSGAVAVLRDKLNAKEREISQLKTQITQMERRLSR